MPTLEAKPTAAGTTWSEYAPTESSPWNLRRVVHLHRRAAFAAPWSELQRDLADGPQAAVDRLLAGPVRWDDDVSFTQLADTIGDAAMASGSSGRLQAWWMFRMLKSPDPLGERLTLTWHNHFATSNRKVQDLVRMRGQNERLRQLARAPFDELLAAAVKHPAMLVWLDADSNRKGHANENLARELMELFTLGIDNFDEHDVQEAARALTGWSIAGGEFGFREARHDDGEKTVLGHTGKLDGDGLLELLVDHPATSQRLAWRLCRTFFGENVVDDNAITQLADGLRENNLDIGWALETVLKSERFQSEANMGTRIAGPAEMIVGSLRALELVDPPPSTLLVAEWAARMGQELLYPPNVGGWNEGRSWLASRTLIARANFARALANGQLWHPPRQPDFVQLAQTYGSATDLAEQIDWYARLLWGTSSPALVEEIIAAVQDNERNQSLPNAVALLLARPENQLA